MKTNRYISAITRASLAIALTSVAIQGAKAGEIDSISAKAPLIDEYIGGNGLLTLTGPTGLFINPTSGTVGEGNSTFQYCFYLPAGSTFDPSGHGWVASYGITDALEIGFVSLYVDGPDVFSVGPQARYRLLKDEGPGSFIPELSLVGYSRFGDDVTLWGVGPALFKRFPIGDENGVVKSLGLHAGARYENNDGTASQDLWNGYAGLELELPFNLYAVGEVSTEESGRGEVETPYALGMQWRNGPINISTAGVQDGATNDGLKLFFGVGLQFQF